MAKLVTLSRDYINRRYRNIPADISIPFSKPKYVFDKKEGKILRVASPLDGKLVTTASLLRGSSFDTQDPETTLEQWGIMAHKVIEHYAQTTLARFLFLMPAAVKFYKSITKGKRPTISEDIDVAVFKGVENLLFEIWDELKPGECIYDITVTRKLRSIIESAK